MIWIVSCADDPIRSVGTGTIAGRVLDDRTATPLEGVMLTTAPASISTLSDSAGSFEILALEEKQYNITASKNGFIDASAIVAIKAGETTLADFSMAPESNQSPDSPESFNPPDGATDLPVTSLILSWSGSDPDPGNSLTYDVHLFVSDGTTQLLTTGQTDTSVQVSDLLFGVTYFWQVIVKDDNGGVQNGSVLRFTTQLPPDNPVIFSAQQGNNYDIYSGGTESLDDRLARLTREPSGERWPRMSPNRSRIAFSSDRTGEPHIFLMDRNGGDPFQVTALPVAGFNNQGIGFGWSPDGTQLIYGHYDRLYRIDVTGGNLILLATAPAGRHFRETDWSPLGDRLAVLTIGSSRYDAEIYLLDTDGSNLTLLVGNDPGALTGLAFSPDGRKVLYSHDISGFEANSGRQIDAHLFTVLLDGAGATDLSTAKPAGTNDLHPRWSPDGSSVVFENVRNDDSELPGLWILDVADPAQRTRIVTEGSMPDWR